MVTSCIFLPLALRFLCIPWVSLPLKQKGHWQQDVTAKHICPFLLSLCLSSLSSAFDLFYFDRLGVGTFILLSTFPCLVQTGTSDVDKAQYYRATNEQKKKKNNTKWLRVHCLPSCQWTLSIPFCHCFFRSKGESPYLPLAFNGTIGCGKPVSCKTLSFSVCIVWGEEH